MNQTREKLVYQALAEHQQTGTAGWDLEDIMKKLHDWAGIFRFQFKLEIPSVPLRMARLRWNCLGHFMPGFNDFGLQNEIALDVKHLIYRLETGSWWEVLATLLHEQLHFWQQLNGKPPKPGPGNYHNIQYRGKAERLGLIISDRGVNEDYVADGPFLRLLEEKGVEVPKIMFQDRASRLRKRQGSKLKKWSCGCKRPINVRVAVQDFQAECLKCHRLFTLQEKPD